ncbi:F-box/kelch-repeat protein [Rhynchospora pubera]|uniref:F-box/kelch-repeat protein n=1 Tax=Rhynchospora pubera TaxID=906938 RepID=A0AAV8C3Q9_9POAL|nr:F-box/kelch-repeat protein [Rhynchospora pubera]
MAMALDLLANRNTETERSLHLSHSHSHSHNHRDRDRDRDRVILDLYGDVLEAVVSRVPSADLIPASRVSREWRRAVRSSLLRLPRRSPWLLLRFLPRPSSPALYSLHAFDPFSSSWLSLPLPHTSTCTTDAVTVTSFLSSSSGDRLHTLSASALSVSQDPFATHWRNEAKAPKMWRKDAVVAEVDRWVVVAGGGCPMVLEEGEVVGAVEVYDKQAGAWASAEPIPPQFDGSAYATWLSAAASDQRLYVMEKKTALVAWFDPQSKAWGPTCQLRLDTAVSAWAIAIGRDERLVAVGVGPVGQSGTKVRFWELNRDTLQPVVADTKTKTKTKMEEEMPTEMVQRLFPFDEGDDDTWRCCSVEVCGTDRGGYVYNPSEMRNGAVLYEFRESEGGSIVGRWEWVPLPERVADCGVGRMEFGCSAVALDDLASFSRHST